MLALGAGDSFYIPDVFESKLFEQLESEVEYIPRHKIKYRIYGKIVTFKRDICYYGETFDYNLIDPPPHDPNWPETVALVRDEINRLYKQKCNSAIVNRYSNDDYIGRHYDSTKSLKPNTPIFSVSFGAPRLFTIGTESVMVKSGSVIILGPKTNRQFKHSVSKGDGVRVSITLRTVK
uniref:Alkylated DNA repair dioxygenase n=1 Tax=Pithovirus LCPAC403 TaxID=2506596 RepID=A0A481ZBY9_9VIRU|nr:MAG: alkylated DNA repair dioxygenase [Pithovirus LCPAC403]